jgi:hypothetical protein
MTLRTRLMLIAVACIGVVSIVSVAQQSLGEVAGIIVDPNDNVITGYSGAYVTMKNTTTDIEFQASLTTDGAFELTELPTGTYDLTVLLRGAMYRTYRQQKLLVNANERLQLRLPIEWSINLGTFADDPNMLAQDMARPGEQLFGPTPRMPDGKPDLSGVWAPVAVVGASPNPFPLQPWAAEMRTALQEARGPERQNAGAYCLPQSAVPFMTGFPWKLVQSTTVLVHLTEFFTPGWRQVFLDDRSHPEVWNPAWHGHSVGQWEGDTLVIETVGYNEITPGFGIHTEELRTIERISRPDLTHLEIEITAYDPGAYTGPWTTMRYGALAPNQEILEFVCPENNKGALTFGAWIGRP